MILGAFEFLNFSFADFLDILLTALLIYYAFKYIRGTSAMNILIGLIFLFVLKVLVSAMGMKMMTEMLSIVLDVGMLAVIVIFQPEIRRILSQVGAFGYFEKPKHTSDGSATPDYVVDTLISLANRRIGALIAFERGISLRSYEHTGVTTDAIFTRELVETIFTPPLPLHDGGVTIRNGRISAAHCVFPVSNNPELITSGMRHRAAVGLSEETDALVIVVSEETGNISVAHNGRLIRYAGEQRAQSLIRWINKAMPDSRLRKGVFAKLNELLSRKGAKK